MGPSGAAFAQDAMETQQAQARAFDIPPQPLADALVLFGEQSGMHVSAHADLVRGLSSPGASGSMTPEEALGQLLAGTGLGFHLTAPDAVTLAKQSGDQSTTTMLPPLTIYGARTTQQLEDVTASVGIVTGETIEERKITSISESFRVLGNVRDSAFNDGGFVIRGINSEGLTPGGAPLASTYIDGVQQTVQGARRGASGLWDVEQVEIYRGPQSTLAGRAALGGAIYVKTKDPIYEFETALRALGGTDERYGGAVMANLPIVDDQLAVRISGEYERFETDINYPTYDEFDRFDELTEDENFTIRGKALLEPGEIPELRALFTYSYSEDRPIPHDIAGPGAGFDWDDERGDFNFPVFSEVRTTTVHNAGLEVTYDITSEWVLTSQTSFSHSDTDRPSVNEGTEGEIFVTTGDFIQKLATQEFRLNYYGEQVEATIGLYGAYDYQDGDRRRFLGAEDISVSEQETWNAAAFGEATYEFYPSWKVLLGGRADYTQTDGSQFFSSGGVTLTDSTFASDDFVFLPKAGLIKEFGEDHTVGFTMQRAFRAGGAGAQFSTGEEFTFDPEYAWNYELSYKGALLDNRLRLTGNLFYLDIKDQQVEVREDPLDSGTTFITNAGKSRAYGFEIEAQADATPELSTFVSIGYVNTKFEDFDTTNFIGDLTGLDFPEAPEWTVAFGFMYEHQSGLFFGADAKYTDDFLSAFGAPPQDRLDDYFIANAQLGYRYKGAALTVFAENLFDEEYLTNNDDDFAGSIGAGRFVGAALELHF
jgi:iron complex outermembrane recepter protein